MWTSLALFNLDESWQLSNPITVNTFRLKHTWVNPYRYSAVAIAALARISNEGIEIYSPQKIYPRTELEIIQFPTPPLKWDYSLAVKQLIFNSNSIQWSLNIDMSLYPINPPDSVNPVASSTYTSTTATVNSTASKILAANLQRKDFMIYNPDSNKGVYLDVSASLSVATATIVIPPGTSYFADFDWTGDVYAIVKTGSVTVSIREFT